MRVSFELSDRDVQHFHECMDKAKEAVRDAEESEIIDAARTIFEEVKAARAPGFVRKRLNNLESMAGMLEDKDWDLPKTPRDRVLRALVYFCDPEDLIPDSIPGIGYLDDAIMIELVFREMKHEIEAYDDFTTYRKKYGKRFKFGRDAATKAKRLKSKRDKLMERIERRKEKDEAERAKSKQPSPIF